MVSRSWQDKVVGNQAAHGELFGSSLGEAVEFQVRPKGMKTTASTVRPKKETTHEPSKLEPFRERAIGKLKLGTKLGEMGTEVGGMFPVLLAEGAKFIYKREQVSGRGGFEHVNDGMEHLSWQKRRSRDHTARGDGACPHNQLS